MDDPSPVRTIEAMHLCYERLIQVVHDCSECGRSCPCAPILANTFNPSQSIFYDAQVSIHLVERRLPDTRMCRAYPLLQIISEGTGYLFGRLTN